LSNLNGTYQFSSPGAGSWYVTPAVGRLQVAFPTQASATPGHAYDFPIRGVRTAVVVRDVPSTFVLLTPAPYPGANSPGNTGVKAYSSTVGVDGKAQINVPNGTYYMTCWRPTTLPGHPMTFTRVPAGTGNTPSGGLVVTPQQSTPITLPSCGE
jgi:hypothetical protein